MSKNKDCVTGQELERIETIGSHYDDNCILLIDDKNNRYKMRVEEIFKLKTDFNSSVFNIIHKRKWDYLEVDFE